MTADKGLEVKHSSALPQKTALRNRAKQTHTKHSEPTTGSKPETISASKDDEAESGSESDSKARSPAQSSAQLHEKNSYAKSTANTSEPKAPFRFTSLDYLLVAAITVISIFIRCYRISEPTEVVFDEVHFGKFAGKYMNRTFFFDLHPPLAKLLFSAAGKLTGYDGIFDFNNIGVDYIANNVAYVGMRMFSGLLGALIVPATYVTVRAAGFSILPAIFGSIAVCLENGLAAQSRLILLDSVLVFFSAYTAMSYFMLRTYMDSPLTPQWWFWLLSTGFNLGCALSSKWIAIFLVAFVGLTTVYDLWEILADKRVDDANYFKQFMSKALALIALPLAIYVISFIIHFQVLYKMSKPDSGFSKEFNSSFEGSETTLTEKNIYYGSTIRIRHTNSNSGYLHSHKHNWKNEKSSKQQQITAYGYPDGNNLFIVEPAFNKTADQGTHVKNGDVIRLKHVGTKKYLHSHDVKPPVSTGSGKYEVSGYGAEDFPGDSNDNFKVEILYGDRRSPASSNQLEAINTKFRLIHSNLKCALYNSRKKLPEYAFGQHEIFCMDGCKPKMSTWHIEYASSNITDSQSELISYNRLSVWGKIYQYNKRMIETNNELLGSHPFASRPQRWPFLYRGTGYWGGKGAVIYQLGNPIVWWCSSASMIIYVTLLAINHLYYKRIGSDLFPIFNINTLLLVMGYAVHYFPFYLIKRELFLHHYLVALWFSTTAFACILELILGLFTQKSKNANKMFRYAAYGIMIALIVNAFIVFYPISYASQFTKDQCAKMKWLPSWDIDCSHAL